MRKVILLFGAFLPSLVSAADLAADRLTDPRNTSEYRVLFDVEARGKSEIVDGYGAYLQIYSHETTQLVRYCENFEGKGTSGRPNPRRVRLKLVPVGRVDDTAYRCREFTLAELATGQPLIKLGERSFFAMKSARWSETDGGEILFQFAQKIPLIGAPTYRTLRIRATRASSSLDYVVETVVPRTGVFPTRLFRFDIAGSALGLPNGVSALTIDPSDRTERPIDLSVLEGPIEIGGAGKDASQAGGRWPKSARKP